MTLISPRREIVGVVAPSGAVHQVEDDWGNAFWSRDDLLRRAWYMRNCRPRVEVANREPLIGEIGIASQADADRLVGRVVRGHVVITAPDVEVRDFWIFADDAEWVLQINQSLSGLHLHHISIDGQRQSGGNKGIGLSTRSPGLHAHHMSIHGMMDGIRYSDQGLYEYMFVYDVMNWPDVSGNVPYDPDLHPHIDGSQYPGTSGGGGFTLRRSYIEAMPGAGIVSCIMLNAVLGPIQGLLIEENYLNGGGHTIRNPALEGWHGPATGIIRNNLFGTNWGTGGGPWGLVDPSSFTRYGNKFAATGRPVPNTNFEMPHPT